MAKVAFVKTQDRASGVRAAIELFDPGTFGGQHLFLKPNYNSADPTPGSTHEEVLRSLVGALRERQAGPITVGDRSGMGSTRSVMQETGLLEIAQELDLDVLVLDELDQEDWIKQQFEGSHWKHGFAVARPALEADGIVQTCCLKTHRYGGHFTLSLKNSVGLVAKRVPGEGHDYMRELHTSLHQRLMIAEINTAYQPRLIVLDGVEAFVKGGPAKGQKVDAGVILAGKDRIAVDAVGVAILRHFGTTRAVRKGPIFQQAQIARAVELGLGVGSPAEIELVTGDDESAAYAAQIREILLEG